MRTLSNHKPRLRNIILRHQAARWTYWKAQASCLTCACDDFRKGSRELPCFVGNTKTADSFCLRAESASSPICSNGALLLCTSSPLVLGSATRNSECEQQIRPSNSRSLHCRNSRHTPAAFRSFLHNFSFLDTRTLACCSEIAPAFWNTQQGRIRSFKLQITQQKWDLEG